MVDYLYNMAYNKTSSLYIDCPTSVLADWLIFRHADWYEEIRMVSR